MRAQLHFNTQNLQTLNQQILNNPSCFNSGEFKVQPLKFIGQALVIDTQLIENSGVEIIDVNAVFYDVIGKIIGFAVLEPGFDAAPGHLHGKAFWVVVATVVGFGELALAVHRTTKLATENHEGIL